MAVLGLRFCARAFSSCGKWRPLFIAVRGPLIIAASLVAEHRLQTHRLSSCGSRAQLLRGVWDLPRPGLKPVSPALAGRFSSTAPPGKPLKNFLMELIYSIVLVSGVKHSDSVIYIYIYIFLFRFFSLIGYYKILSIVPCAIQYILVGYLFYT